MPAETLTFDVKRTQGEKFFEDIKISKVSGSTPAIQTMTTSDRPSLLEMIKEAVEQ